MRNTKSMKNIFKIYSRRVKLNLRNFHRKKQQKNLENLPKRKKNPPKLRKLTKIEKPRKKIF